MRKYLNPDRQEQESTTSLHGNVSNRAGNMRAVIAKGKTVNTAQNPGMASAIQESIDYAFGRNECDAQIAGDRDAYILKGAALKSDDTPE